MIFVNEPLLTDRDAELVNDCVRTGWISSAGKYIDQFESEWAKYCGRRYGIAVSSGTTALHAAVAAINLKPGDEVILPSFTIVSCALAVVYSGGVPIFVDCDPETWTMKAEDVAEKISPRTKAIMPVHIYGHPVDMIPILEIAKKNNLAVIEDAAEAHGAEYRVENKNSDHSWRRCGSFGDVSIFSFYGNKLITTGEGGMVLTDDDKLATKVRSLRNLCFIPEQRFRHEELGFNFRMTNMQAALGVAQLERFDEIVAKKRSMGKSYYEALSGIDGLQLPVEREWAKNVYWMYGVVLSKGRGSAKDFSRKLLELGIDSRPFFLGLHEQPALQGKTPCFGGPLPVTENIARQGLYLPSGLTLTESNLAQVCDSVKSLLN